MDTKDKVVLDLIKFRSLMGCNVTEIQAKYIWGRAFTKSTKLHFGKSTENKYVQEKVRIAKSNIRYFLIFNWVKFVGISGSVAAGFAKEDDDIDLFIVVKNGTAWIYRGVLMLRNIFGKRIRIKKDGKNVKDKFCINFICEERGLTLDSDMFNFHELMYLIPAYNEGYINYIYSQNPWLRDEYQVKKEFLITKENNPKFVSIFVRFLNALSFAFQLLFMIISRHSPEIKRLKENYKKGRIEFFSSKYKNKRLMKYLEPIQIN